MPKFKYPNDLIINYINGDSYTYSVGDIIELRKEDDDVCYLKFIGKYLPLNPVDGEPYNEMVVDVRLERNDCLKTVKIINQEIYDEIIIDYNTIIDYLKMSSTVKGVGNTPLSFLKVEYVGVNNGRKN